MRAEALTGIRRPCRYRYSGRAAHPLAHPGSELAHQGADGFDRALPCAPVRVEGPAQRIHQRGADDDAIIPKGALDPVYEAKARVLNHAVSLMPVQE